MINGIKKLFKPVDLTIGSPWKVMLFFAVPILLSTLLNNAFSLINALVLKSTVGGVLQLSIQPETFLQFYLISPMVVQVALLF